MSKSLIKRLVYLLTTLTYFITLPIICIKDFAYPFRMYIFSFWINRKYNLGGGLFKSPINKIMGGRYFRIGRGTSFGRYATVTAWDSHGKEHFSPSVIIGENCNFGDFLHLTITSSIVIGNNLLTGRWVTISDNSHGTSEESQLSMPPIERPIHSNGGISIGNNVWIGDKATILSGVTIGDGAVIGANAVVTKDIPPFSIAVGNPVRIYPAKQDIKEVSGNA